MWKANLGYHLISILAYYHFNYNVSKIMKLYQNEVTVKKVTCSKVTGLVTY